MESLKRNRENRGARFLSRYAGERVPQRFQASEKGKDLPVQKWHFWGCRPTVTSLPGGLIGLHLQMYSRSFTYQNARLQSHNTIRIVEAEGGPHVVRAAFSSIISSLSASQGRRQGSGCDNGIAALKKRVRQRVHVGQPLHQCQRCRHCVR